MEKLAKGWTLKVLGLVVALPLAVACSSSDSQGGDGSDGTGGTGDPPSRADSPVGEEFERIGSAAAQVTQSNAEAFEGLGFTVKGIADALGAAQQTAGLREKGGQQPCFTGDIGGATFEYLQSAAMYVPTGPGAPVNGIRFLVYEVDGDTPNTDNEIGTLDVVCVISPQGVDVSITLTANDVVVLSVNATNAFVFVGSYSFQLAGFIASADGAVQVPFGQQQGSFASGSSFDSNFSSSLTVDFTVGEDTFATLSRFVSSSVGFNEEFIDINVVRGLFTEFVFDFFASLFGTPGSVSGPGLFTAVPPLGNGAQLFVACFSGSFENMTVQQASNACGGEFGYEPVPLSDGDLAVIQAAYDALRDAFKVIEDIVEAGVAVGLALTL